MELRDSVVISSISFLVMGRGRLKLERTYGSCAEVGITLCPLKTYGQTCAHFKLLLLDVLLMKWAQMPQIGRFFIYHFLKRNYFIFL